MIKLDNDITLVLEVKEQDTIMDQEKRQTFAEWIEAVNFLEEYGA